MRTARVRSRAVLAAGAVLAAAVTTLVPAPAHAAAGDLDLTFSTDGRATHDIGGCEDSANDVAQGLSGTLVAVGSSCRTSDFTYAATVVRLTSAGAKDTTFGGGDGIVTTADESGTVGDETSEFRAVAVSAAGEVYAAGSVADEAAGEDDLLVVKYSVAGDEVDRWSAHVGDAGSVDSLDDLRVDGTGAVTAAGTSCSFDETSETCKVVAVHLTPDLDPDTTFDTDGLAFSATGFFPVVHVLADGRVAAIDYDSATDTDRLRLYTTALAADPGFASGAAKTLQFYAFGLTSTATHLFVAGEDYDDIDSDQAVAKLGLDGAYDPTFSGNGIIFSDLGDDEYASEITVDGAGNVYTAGGHNDGGASTVSRYTSNGVLDPRFGEAGSVRLVFPGFDSNSVGALTVQADGKPVTAGWANNDASGAQDMAFARFIAAIPPNPPRYTGVTPARLLDTRPTSALSSDGRNSPLGGGQVFDLPVLGQKGVPSSGVSAVVLNVTAISPTATGYVAVYPTGTPFPGTANVQFTPKAVVANLVTVKVGEGGKVRLYNSAGTTNLAVDVSGWYSDGKNTAPSGGQFRPLAPARLLDSRPNMAPTNEGVNAPLKPSQTITLDVTGRGGVPTQAGAVVLNLTVANATSGAHLTAYPSGASLPGVSNLNFATNQTIANLAIIKVGSDGTIKIRNGSSRGSVNVIADVSGYFTHSTLTSATSISGSFQPLTPQRIFDTRVGLNTTKAKIPANGVRTIQIAGRGRVPLSGATSVVVHVIASSPTVNGYLTVFPGNLTTRPNASNVNFYAGKAASNAVIVKVPTSGTGAGQIKVANSGGTTDVIVDVMGWYS